MSPWYSGSAGTHVTAGQVELPSGVTLVTDPEALVALVRSTKPGLVVLDISDVRYDASTRTVQLTFESLLPDVYELTAANTLKWMAVLARHTRFDGIGFGDLYRLGRLALTLDPDEVRNVTMPGTTGSAANQSVVFVGGSAPALFADFSDDAILQRS